MKHFYLITVLASLIGSISVSANDTYTFEELKSLISSATGELQISGTNKSLERIVISMLDVYELLRSTNRCFEGRRKVPPGTGQLAFDWA